MDVSAVRERLEHTIRYKKKWNNYNTYVLAALSQYVDYCEQGGYTKCILSKTEFANIAAKKK